MQKEGECEIYSFVLVKDNFISGKHAGIPRYKTIDNPSTEDVIYLPTVKTYSKDATEK
jgi:hypothetical protein